MSLIAADMYDLPEEGEETHSSSANRAQTKFVKDKTGELIIATIPKHYGEAIKSPEAQKWKEAMDKEFQAHQNRGTWKLVPASSIAKHRKVVGSTWAYDVKRTETGEISRYKARFCAQGFSQIEGYDYVNTYSNTIRYSTLRALLATCAELGLELTSADITTAYLYGILKEKIYMRQPRGYELTGPNNEPMLCELIHSIYGLKQSGAEWETAYETSS